MNSNTISKPSMPKKDTHFSFTIMLWLSRKNKIRNYHVTGYDLEQAVSSIAPESFDGIIADVPCTGSGTWARTPENISFFKEDDLKYFIRKQEQIVDNVIPLLKGGCPLIYITCSVFKDENERMIEMLNKKYNMIVESSGLIEGSQHGADTMFAARLIKPD